MRPSLAVSVMFFFARHKHRVLAFILVWLGSSVVVSVPTFAERFPIKTYGTPEGLGSSFIERIFQDSHGYLWVCTRDGLSRFDGYSFKTYKTSDGLPVPNVSSILENDDGTFWVTTNGGGVCKFDPGGKTLSSSRNKNASLFTNYSLGNNDFSNRANMVYRDKQGRIWVGTDSGLFRLDKEAEGETFKHVPIDANSYDGSRQPGVRMILQDRKGEIWIVSGTKGIYRIVKDGRVVHYTPQRYSAFTEVNALLEECLCFQATPGHAAKTHG